MQQKWKLQFSIGFLLFAMLIVAGYFYGLNRGDAVRYNTTLSTKTYSVANLLDVNEPIDQQLDTITNLIQQSIAPDSWTSSGGMGSLTIYTANQSIVVHQYGTEHQKTEELLDSLETLINEEMEVVRYDVSQIVKGNSPKSVDKQLATICMLTSQTFENLGTPLTVSIDAENRTIVASARKQTHAALAAFFEQLRFARKTISEIDG